MADTIIRELEDAGHTVGWTARGASGLAWTQSQSVDLITLDRLLPDIDGLSLLAELRRRGIDAPVLVVSALDAVDERVRGLRAGGDDYLPKPFASSELVARVEALLRRQTVRQARTQLTVGDLLLDLLTREASRAGRSLIVTARQLGMLECLMRRRGCLVTRAMLFEAVWDHRFDPRTNVIDVHIGRLRRQIDLAGEPPMITTVRGEGWILDAPG